MPVYTINLSPPLLKKNIFLNNLYVFLNILEYKHFFHELFSSSQFVICLFALYMIFKKQRKLVFILTEENIFVSSCSLHLCFTAAGYVSRIHRDILKYIFLKYLKYVSELIHLYTWIWTFCEARINYHCFWLWIINDLNAIYTIFNFSDFLIF